MRVEFDSVDISTPLGPQRLENAQVRLHSGTRWDANLRDFGPMQIEPLIQQCYRLSSDEDKPPFFRNPAPPSTPEEAP